MQLLCGDTPMIKPSLSQAAAIQRPMRTEGGFMPTFRRLIQPLVKVSLIQADRKRGLKVAGHKPVPVPSEAHGGLYLDSLFPNGH